jgi:hypothetical protein
MTFGNSEYIGKPQLKEVPQMPLYVTVSQPQNIPATRERHCLNATISLTCSLNLIGRIPVALPTLPCLAAQL